MKLPKVDQFLNSYPRLDLMGLCGKMSKIKKIAAARMINVDFQKLETLSSQYAALSKDLKHHEDLLNQNTEKIRDQKLKNQTVDLENAKNLKKQFQHVRNKFKECRDLLSREVFYLPNDISSFTPNLPKCIEVFGPNPKSTAPSHVDLCEKFDLADFTAGSKVSGASFYFLKKEAVLLEFALIQHSMKVAMDAGFIPISTPDVVRTCIASSCGYIPRESRLDSYKVSEIGSKFNNEQEKDLVLAATAELPMAGMYANTYIPATKLPLLFVGHGHAFRAEAGAAGSATRGLYRVHQFPKVELFAICNSFQSNSVFELILQVQKTIMEQLELTVRQMEMPASDLGASAYRKIDMEAWIPSRQTWGEISSASNCTDYQARRLNIISKAPRSQSEIEDYKKMCDLDPETNFAHTLNGTAAAIPRLLIAILEQNYNDGTISIPSVLQPYVGKSSI